jgi:co-chaperonin GroES (HSP10)
MQILGTAVLIKPDKLPERTPQGRLVIPRNSKELLPEWGIVIDSGPACEGIKKGDRVHFPRKSASVIVIDEEDFYFTSEHKIFYYEQREQL